MSEKTPFVEVGLVVVDGNNLLHRTAGGPGPTAARLLLARLRAALPAGVRAIVVLDGPADPGGPLRVVIAPSPHVRHPLPHSPAHRHRRGQDGGPRRRSPHRAVAPSGGPGQATGLAAGDPGPATAGSPT